MKKHTPVEPVRQVVCDTQRGILFTDFSSNVPSLFDEVVHNFYSNWSAVNQVILG